MLEPWAEISKRLRRIHQRVEVAEDTWSWLQSLETA